MSAPLLAEIFEAENIERRWVNGPWGGPPETRHDRVRREMERLRGSGYWLISYAAHVGGDEQTFYVYAGDRAGAVELWSELQPLAEREGSEWFAGESLLICGRWLVCEYLAAPDLDQGPKPGDIEGFELLFPHLAAKFREARGE